MTVYIVLIVVTILLAAFFSGMELAFISSNKFRIEIENKQGYLPAKIFSGFNKAPSKFISAMLVGNNVVLVLYGTIMAKLLEPPIREFISNEPTVVLIQTFVSTILILVTGEFLPKAIFRNHANTMLNVFAVPVYIFYQIFYPVVYVTSSISEWIIKYIFRVHLKHEEQSFGRLDLHNYLNEATSTTGREPEDIDTEIKIFQNALLFSDIKVRESMIPRTEIVAVDVEETVEELSKKFVETGLSKILIYSGNIDNIIGYVHTFELFKKPETIREVIFPVSNVPETMPAKELLRVFMQQHRSIAVVVDEFGGTAGMVTIEDVVEEIFGEIEDEHDVDELVEAKISETEFLFSARLEIDYLNNEYGLHLPVSDEYETLGGLLLNHHESIPEKGEEIRIDKYLFTITVAGDSVTEQVNLKIMQ
jgi:CBS domain containing-hemolysin-like protein